MGATLTRGRPEARLHADAIGARIWRCEAARPGGPVSGRCPSPKHLPRVRGEPGEAPQAQARRGARVHRVPGVRPRSSRRSVPSSASEYGESLFFPDALAGAAALESAVDPCVGATLLAIGLRTVAGVGRGHGAGRARGRADRLRVARRSFPRPHTRARLHQHRHGHAARRRGTRRLAAAGAQRPIRRARV